MEGINCVIDGTKAVEVQASGGEREKRRIKSREADNRIDTCIHYYGECTVE
jgi:hypothetical protein